MTHGPIEAILSWNDLFNVAQTSDYLVMGEYNPEDVTELLIFHPPPDNDDPWVAAGRFRDGKYFVLTGSSAYSGWDVAGGGELVLGDSYIEVFSGIVTGLLNVMEPEISPDARHTNPEIDAMLRNDDPATLGPLSDYLMEREHLLAGPIYSVWLSWQNWQPHNEPAPWCWKRVRLWFGYKTGR